ncbi:Uncharacterised protein [Mycobacteroides abscessus subsp. bolletii]|uniref:Uncharacterized protein n=1 Tax=Mycobacteroides abscessus subsp. bolletii TaxID=319705 RepID=A0A9Q7SFZ6_9MYCO|nr:hypothetical protein [Mycobacteroides abscessus]MDO3070510.1 hypothetical protein [Mycobacteroides abscessus subsp. bolletii]SHU58793.1 Uncharacterised protein [Mycobacteroides abscessus subsp. bolletii]SHU81552.1 Uncharacterised protein [Mycobacteroides abscessus subsp. bolletii]SHX61867.1 Uncharacterised protein [Mycobacteroides abscessus subsp. bolletii]SKM19157.1 Uncharacterised protein [Mycobacteroides abscessus subsp. bolletii]
MQWRSTASPQVQSDLDMLYTDSISLVAEDLGHSDTFGPLMLVVERGGGKALRRTAGVQTPLRESEIVKQLEAPGDAETLRARATVLDVTVKEPFTGDAIKIKLEHAEGVAIDILVPYRVTAEGKSIDVNAQNAAVAERLLWRASS